MAEAQRFAAPVQQQRGFGGMKSESEETDIKGRRVLGVGLSLPLLEELPQSRR